MSVELQAPHDHKQFGINSTQFEEIVPMNRTEPRSSNLSSKQKEKAVEPSDKDIKKQLKESKSKSNYSSDGHGSYNDDFEECETPTPRKVQQKSKPENIKSTPKRRQMSNSSASPEISTAKSSSILSPRSSKNPKKKYNTYSSPRSSSLASSRPPEKGWQRSKNRSANVKVSRLDESVGDRVLSANRHRVQKLESRLSQLVKELSSERDENKTLRQIHYRQEKELIKVNSNEAELPQLLQQHTTEVKSLRMRLRKLHETTVQNENKLNDQDKEILKLKDRCKYYKDLCEMKNLTERADLQKKLTEAQNNLEKKDSEISKLQRMVNLKEKTHVRHLREQKDKLRETESKFKAIEQNYDNLQERLKEKEKQLDYTNIYQRQIVLKEKSQSSPEAPPKIAALPAPKKLKSKTKKPNNVTKNNNDKKEKTEEKELEVNKKPDSFFLTAHSDTGCSDEELDKGVGKAAEDKQLSIRDSGNVLDIGMLNKSKTVEEDMAEENERHKKEEFERSLREEDERLKKEKEDFERKKKELEEREEREKAEREAKWQEDSARRAQEEHEQRQESARRKREEDERRKAEEIKEKQEDNFFDDGELQKKKDQLLARLKAIDNERGPDPYHSDGRKSSSGKSGHENRNADAKLQNGLPPLGKESSVVSPPVSVKSDPDGFFGIPKGKPVLIGRGNLVKKSSPFSWLDNNNNNKRTGGKHVKQNDDFGDYSPSMSKKKPGDLEGDTFGQRAARGRRHDREARENGFDFGEQRGSGGFDKPKQNNLAFLSEDFGNKKKGDGRSISPSNNEPLLPRRRAQEKTGPAISSAFDDNLDDDIEELTL